MSREPGSSKCLFPSETRGQLDALRPTSVPFSGPSSVTPSLAFATQPPALFPRSQDDSCSPTPNEVLLKISTEVLIPNYSSFYPATPIENFRMSYTSFPDGSLVAPPYLLEQRHANFTLLFTGMALMLFITNTFFSAGYVRRGRVKYKGLFYALLLSQVLGVIAFTLEAVSLLAREFNCTSSVVIIGILEEISSAILLSGILGVKAYKCLGDSKIVLAFIAVVQLASSTSVFVELTSLKATRDLNMACVISEAKPILFSLTLILRFVIALFLCLCFCYALWKSEKLPVAQGRISVRLSGYIPPDMASAEKDGSIMARPRGWWDYVPGNNASHSDPQESRASTWHLIDDRGFVSNMRYLVRALVKEGSSTESSERKSSDATLVVSQRQHQPKPSVVRFQDDGDNSRFSLASDAPSSTPSRTRSLGSLMNRMKLFREVMRNELAHIALITLFNVVASVLGLAATFSHLRMDPQYFVGSYLATLSILVMHSSGRVIERHKREAILQHTLAWDPLYVEKTNGDQRRGRSSISVAPNPQRPTADPFTVAEDPFADFEFIGTSSDVISKAQRDGVAPEAGTPSTKTESLLPEAPNFPYWQRDKGDLFFSPPQLSRDSVSKYSDTSSRPRSLFYLEEEE